MRKIISLLMAVLLSVGLYLPVCATDDEPPEINVEANGTPGISSSAGDNEAPPASEQQPETPKPEEKPVQQDTPKPEEKPTTTDSSGASSGGGGGGSYTSPIVNIEAQLDDGTTIVLPFLDVPQDAYYTAAVAWAYSHDPQITDGVNAERFDPLGTCTRGQMVTFLWRAAGCPEPTGTASAFSDVTAGAYYEKAVAWAVENKITDGVGDGKFDPNGIVNRAQAVTFLYRAKGAPETAASSSFADVASGAYYENAVAWAVANGVTNGVSDNSFAPNNNCVRGQTVTFLYRAYK